MLHFKTHNQAYKRENVNITNITRNRAEILCLKYGMYVKYARSDVCEDHHHNPEIMQWSKICFYMRTVQTVMQRTKYLTFIASCVCMQALTATHLTRPNDHNDWSTRKVAYECWKRLIRLEYPEQSRFRTPKTRHTDDHASPYPNSTSGSDIRNRQLSPI